MIKRLLILCAIWISFLSCNNDIDLNETFKDIPVVYAIINAQDTAQYIRVERVFNDRDKSAYDIAKIVDSIYYPEAKVFLVDESTKKVSELKKIDGNLDNIKRDTGLLAQVPNYLYKIKTSTLNFNPNHPYSLIVLKNDDDTLTTSKINPVQSINLYLPVSNGKPVKIPYSSSLNAAWNGGQNAGFYDIFLIFHIKELNLDVSPDWVNKTYIWKAGKEVEETTFRIKGTDFFKSFEDFLTQDTKIKRKFNTMDVMVRGVGKEMKQLKDIINLNTGITSSIQLPSYSNLTYGYGIFSTTNTSTVSDLFLDETSRDSLKLGIYTKRFNFE